MLCKLLMSLVLSAGVAATFYLGIWTFPCGRCERSMCLPLVTHCEHPEEASELGEQEEGKWRDKWERAEHEPEYCFYTQFGRNETKTTTRSKTSRCMYNPIGLLILVTVALILLANLALKFCQWFCCSKKSDKSSW